MTTAGLLVSALRGGSGKTIVSVGLIAALARQGRSIAPFKKGPDYIDAGWLALAAGRPCYNLDTFLVSPELLERSFWFHGAGHDLSLVEGNRGLYDSIDTEGRTSTAELAKLLGLPVIVCLDCTKTTRTMAAVMAGCKAFDPAVQLAGVVLNHVAGARHESILRRSIEQYCGVRVFGAIPKLRQDDFPERHMGLVPTAEHPWACQAVASAGDLIGRCLDLDAVMEAARDMRAPAGVASPYPADRRPGDQDPLIAVARDSAFQFYYPENITALEAAGARVVEISPLRDAGLPAIDGLYIGGGFPETHAEALGANASFRHQIKQLAEAGLPIYAECGGLMYLGRELEIEGRRHPMADVFPLAFTLCRRPQGHGYTVAEVVADNPFFPVGRTIKGHEFHYSRAAVLDGAAVDFAFAVNRGAAITDGRDGIHRYNALATYIHIHALGAAGWAEALVAAARRFRQVRVGK